MTTPNMNLTLPIVSQTPGPTWASEINSDLALIDAHNHTSGQGAPIPVSALDINTDLSLGAFALTNVSKVELLTQASNTTANSIYQSGGNLYWLNNSSFPVLITNGNALAVGSTGNIGGLPDGLASVNYDNLVFAYRFKDSVNANAGIVVGPVVSSRVTIDSVSIDTPPGASTYQITTASALPGNTSFLTCSSTGQIGYTTQSGGITSQMLAAVNYVVSGQYNTTLISSGNLTPTIPITTTGRPIALGFTSLPTDPPSSFLLDNPTPPAFQRVRVGFEITSPAPPPGFVSGNYLVQEFSGNFLAALDTLAIPTSSLNGIVNLPAGLYNIRVVATQVSGSAGTPQLKFAGRFFVYEL